MAEARANGEAEIWISYTSAGYGSGCGPTAVCQEMPRVVLLASHAQASLGPRGKVSEPLGGSGGACYCHALYGAPMPFGCRWFGDPGRGWVRNIDRAVALRQQLIVYGRKSVRSL